MIPAEDKTCIEKKSRPGFSLIEILVALCILGVVLLPFLSFISYRLSKEHEIDEKIRAVEIARVFLEEALLTPDIQDSEIAVEEKYMVKIKVYDGDQYDEPDTLPLTEISVAVFHIQDVKQLVELHALKR
jgi:prepilin-type N-terminal cleavage/methylation domain-containing protein